MVVEVPPNACSKGSMVQVRAGDGQLWTFEVPDGLSPGQTWVCLQYDQHVKAAGA